ncbi:hypothetical protein [Bradyrhizobium sp. BR 10289]|uniref:hypothetical protein n=1 Tax=Bradyrhizobium sp. BR 10289 TaxID=2749993 RepID=UPI001C64BCEB|nr:hypothetical protein [Bradyrhizobium sp. BR 10289]MBW7970984.1 hypothetical protein [Bradyrhizobium sp. BR 10289]
MFTVILVSFFLFALLGMAFSYAYYPVYAAPVVVETYPTHSALIRDPAYVAPVYSAPAYVSTPYYASDMALGIAAGAALGAAMSDTVIVDSYAPACVDSGYSYDSGASYDCGGSSFDAGSY